MALAKSYAPTLYTVLVNPDDDRRLFGMYPTLAGETETYLRAKANEEGLVMDGAPLVRFMVDDDLKHGKFDVIAELVSAPIIAQLRNEELERYGLAQQPGYGASARRRQIPISSPSRMIICNPMAIRRMLNLMHRTIRKIQIPTNLKRNPLRWQSLSRSLIR